MWANTSPSGGLIVVGVADDGEFLGCEGVDTKRINKLENAGYDYTSGVIYETKRVRVRTKDGREDWVLLFRVHYNETRVIETNKHKVFVRRGDSKIELRKDEERRQLRIDKGEVQFEQEPCNLKYPDDFDRQTLSTLMSNVRSHRHLDDATPDEKVLAALRLGKWDGKTFSPNIACAILLAKDPVSVIPGCKIHLLQFEGTEEKRGPDYNEIANLPLIEGPIPTQIAKVNEILEQKIRRFSGFGEDGKFHTTPEYPKAAWNEAIVNACVHRSYNFRNMKTFVRVFDDRLEVESPGGFPPGITPDTIYDVQHSRNPFLMEAMRYLGFVKEIGEGVPRMRDEMMRLSLPAPVFSQREVDGVMVRVVLKNNIAMRRKWVDSDVAAMLGERIVKNMTDKEKMVVNYTILHGSINVSQAQRLTEHNWHTSKKLLGRLTERGILRYVKRDDTDIDRKAYYEINLPGVPGDGDK